MSKGRDNGGTATTVASTSTVASAGPGEVQPQGTIVNRPKPFVQKVSDILAASKDQIALALPKHLTPDRMIRVAMVSLKRNPDLWKCDPHSVVGCIIQASQLGLEIDGILGHAYLVPFKGTANLIIGYKGYLELARRSGEVNHFSAHVVHANDHFDYEYGTESKLVHKPNLANPGDPIAVYAVIKLRDGAHDFEVIGWPEILKKKAQYGSRSSSPWNSHIEPMACKSAIRKLAQRCPVSAEIRRAVALDEAADRGQSQMLESSLGMSRSDSLMARLPAPTGPKASQVDIVSVRKLLKDLAMPEEDWYILSEQWGIPGDLTQATVEQGQQAVAQLEEMLRATQEESREEADAVEGDGA